MDSRLLRVKERIGKEFRNAQPFHSVKVPDSVQLAEYFMMPPEMKTKFLQDPQTRPAAVKYIDKMEKLKKEYFDG